MIGCKNATLKSEAIMNMFKLAIYRKAVEKEETNLIGMTKICLKISK